MRILGDIERGVGFAAVNSLAKGAVFCAIACMEEPEVLRAALGNPAPLAALQGREELGKALRAAAAGGLLAPLESLLGRRGEVEVDAKDGAGRTPLHKAAIGGHAAAAEALLRAGADVGAKDKFGDTPLNFAQRYKHEQVAELLRRHGAQALYIDSDGYDVIDHCDEE